MKYAFIRDTNIIVVIKNEKLYKNPNQFLCTYVCGNRDAIVWNTWDKITTTKNRNQLQFIDDITKYLSKNFESFL